MNTIVMYSTDNGAETGTWPGVITPFHGEKSTTWEGGMRIPMVVKWPGVIKPGKVNNDIISLIDWMPTLVAAAGEPNGVEKLKNGYEANGWKFKIHANGYNLPALLQGQSQEGALRGDLLFWPGRRTERRTLE
jgi:arylsulfatase A-like enzyme